MKLLSARNFLSFLLALAPAAAIAATLRVAIPNPPIGRGNPYQATGPANAYVAPAIFDALTVMDADGQPQPALATSWDSDPSARVWTFRLRPGVTFSNGEPFNAEAVVAALEYLTRAPQPADLVPLEFADVDSFRAIDPLTIEITARGPAPLLPRAVSVLFVVAPEAWRRLGPQGFANAPVGTGPFQVENWGAAGISLRAFTKSWRAPKVERLEFLFQLEATARLQSLLSGRSDIAIGLGAETRPSIEAAGGTLAFVSLPQTMTIMVLPDKPGSPFADVRVRRALNYAVNKNRLNDAFFDGLLAPTGQPAARTSLGYDPAIAPYPYDPTRAKALLTEAGYGDGFSFVAEAPVGSTGSDAAVYQQIAQDLAAVKVEMVLRAITGLKFGQVFRTGGWGGHAFTYLYSSAPTFDGIRALKYYRCGYQPLTYCDPVAEPLFAEADLAPDIERRASIGRRIMARYHDQAAAIFLYEAPGFHGVAASVRNFRMDNFRIAFDGVKLGSESN